MSKVIARKDHDLTVNWKQRQQKFSEFLWMNHVGDAREVGKENEAVFAIYVRLIVILANLAIIYILV